MTTPDRSQPGGDAAELSNDHDGSDASHAGPMTAAQAAYLQMLSEEAQEPFDAALTEIEAARLIDELQERTGRGPIRLRPVI